ncbi:MAG TPA: AMP-binding protein [Terriglobales bacterium]|nr:AMP-binding protein [Terriglobales bacterium]
MQGFYARFLESVERWPQNVAVEMQREASLDRHTYAELRRMAESVGRWLTESGVARGSRCVVLAQNRPRWVAAYLGAVAAGMVAVPFDTAFKADQIGRLLRDCGASVVFTDCKNLETARRAAEGLSIRMVLLDGEEADAASLDAILAAGPGNFRPAETQPEDLAVILYTSGTTAEPQGVMLTQDNLMGEIESVFLYLDVRPTDVILGVLPLFHALAQMANLMLPLSGGASVVYLETLNTAELLRALRERQVTIFVCVPQFFYLIHERVLKQVKEGGAATQTTFRFLMGLSRLGRRLGWNLGKVFFRKAHEALGTSMRYLITGGSRFDAAIGHDLDALGFDILQAYGLTETSGGAVATPPAHNVIGSVGRPLPDVEAKIVDAQPPENGDGEGPPVGEVAIRGRIVMKGYYNRPDITALALRDGWLHTGDLGYFDSGGNLFITGRRKEIIVLSSGKNISPEEVEQHYLKCQWAKEMCVMGLQSRPGEPFSERLHGVVVPNFELLKQKHIVNTREVIRWEFESLSQQLPSTKRILSFDLWQEELPRTTTRKLKRFEIQKKVEAKRAAADPEAAPEAARPVTAEDQAWLELPDVQRALKVVRQAVKPPPAFLHPADNLELDLALDSMERVELLVALEHELGAAVDESVVSGVYTVREMVDAVRSGVDAVGSGVGAAGGPRGFAGWDAVFATEPTDPELLAIDEPHPLRSRTWFLIGRVVDLFARDRFQFRITGMEKLPPHGPFILCPNHQSYLDPILLASALPYSLFKDHFSVGTSEIFGQGIMNWIARSLKIVVVDPDSNLVPAMRAGAYGLRRGKMLLLFPEGERTIDGPPKVFKKGAAILSIHMKVPIYPVALDGFFDAWPRGRPFQGFLPLRMAIGDPIYPSPLGNDPEATYDALTHELKAQLMAMWTPMHAELHGDTLEPGQLATAAD